MVIPQFREKLLKLCSRVSREEDVEDICKQASLGDWFLLNQLSKNMDALIFRDFLHALSGLIENGGRRKNS